MREDEKKSKSILNAAKSAVDEAKESSQSSKSRGNLYSSLMKQKETGNIKGICVISCLFNLKGRLGNLGVIDDKYDVAVTTACGSLDSIVVETVECGQKCIEYLKKHDLGRANFICLDKLKEKDMGPISTPENVPRLFDLIKPKESRYKVAFYQGLNNTLVALDLTQANRIAYGKTRYRVVTLDGQLIDTSGTMSGGGNKVQKGGMSSKYEANSITPKQMEKLMKDLEIAEESYGEVKRRLADLLNENSASEIPKIELEISKLSLNLESIQKEIQDYKSHIETLEK